MPAPAGQAFLQRISRGLPPPGYVVWPDENTIGDVRPLGVSRARVSLAPSALPLGPMAFGFLLLAAGRRF